MKERLDECFDNPVIAGSPSLRHSYSCARSKVITVVVSYRSDHQIYLFPLNRVQGPAREKQAQVRILHPREPEVRRVFWFEI